MNLRASSIFLLLGFFALFFSGCQDDKNASSTGKIKLKVAASGAVTDVTTRSGEENVPDVNHFSVEVLQEGNVQASWGKLSDYDEDTTFPVGAYTMKAFYGDMEKEGFASPYYEGSTNLVIQSGATTEVEATCKLTNTKITIEYTDDFKSYFKTYSSIVKSELGSEVTFASTETRAAYVKPGRVSVKVTFTKATGGVGSNTVDVATIEAALPQHHYHLLMDVDAGKAMLSVIFDRVTEEKPVTLDVSDKALNIKAPYFTLTGFEKTSNDNNQWDGNLTEANKLSALLTSLGGFKKCILRTTSKELSGWKQEGYDLVNLTDEDLAFLTQSGIKLIGFGANKDQMAIIDFTGVVPHLNISDANSEHLFYLQVTSTYGKESEQYVLNLTTPKNFMLLPAEAVKMSATIVKLPVKLKEGNPDNVELYYKNYGTWTRIPQVSQQPIAGKPGYYEFTATDVSMGFVAKEFIARYNGVESSVVKVAVIVPNYTIELTEEDMWAHEAVVTVTPENPDDLSNIMKSIEAYYLSKEGKWIKTSREKEGNRFIITKLLAGTSYLFKTTCDDGGNYSNEVTGMTEDAIAVPNVGFDTWGDEISYPGIQNGGRSSYPSGFLNLGSSYNNYVYVTISYWEPNLWSTTNSLTVPSNASNKNSWYMVPSVLKVSDTQKHMTALQLRNVAWNNAGTTVSDNTKSDVATSNKNVVQPPSNFKRSAGKVYLGSLNSSNEDMGIDFKARPKQLIFSYKYAPKEDTKQDNVGGTLKFSLQSESGVVLAEKSIVLSEETWKEEVVDISYMRTNIKAAKLRIMFTSSTFWSSDQNKENNDIETIHEMNNSDAALKTSVGSSLYLDDIRFVY